MRGSPALWRPLRTAGLRNRARSTRNEATGCTMPTAWELITEIPVDMKRLLLLPVLFVLPAASYAQARTYTTTFPSSENSVSEGGNWINGRTTGFDWSNVRTIPGFAFGTQTGATAPPYNDSTAVLTGSWGATQFAQATVRAVSCTDSSYEEVELLLHTTITAHSITGYEFNFRCSQSAQAYAQIVRWNGPVNDFTYLARPNGPQYGVKNGDVVTATIVGNVLHSYINGVLVVEATDSTYTTGSPGLAFFFQGSAGSASDFGFSSFTASDSIPPQPRKNLTAIQRLQFIRTWGRHMTIMGINWAAVVVAAIAWMVVGLLWYSPFLFARPWMLAMGFALDDKAAIEALRKAGGRLYGIAFLASLLSAAVLAKLFSATATFSVLRGLEIAFAVWLGFVATLQLTGVLFGRGNLRAFVIDTGYQLVGYLVAGAILAAWR